MSLFGDSDQSLNITIKAKDEASTQIVAVRKETESLTKSVFKGTEMAHAFEASLRFVQRVLSDSLTEYEQLTQAIGQTNAVLTSTQHAAGLTATEIVDLSKSLSDNTLYQDDMVLSAENMLLTFTNITKDIFPQTTQAVLDMSTALGQDLSSSAIQLGKALNNPIEGVSALQRVGVSFNNAQQEMIAAMVKSGRTMDAQRFILAELEKEFGGSAKSAYESASSVTRLQKSVKDLEQGIGAGLTPALNNLFGAFQETTAGMGHTVDVGKAAFITFARIEEVAVSAGVAIHSVAAATVNVGVTIAKLSTQMTGINTVMKAFGVDSDKFFDDWTDSLHEQVDTTSQFYFNLKDKNDAVIESWGDVTAAAAVLGKAGPAAYQATSEEAKKAADQIKKTQQAIADTKKTLDDYRKDLKGESNNIAELFAEQEKTVHEAALKVQEARKRFDDEQTKLGKNPNDKDQQEALRAANTDLNDAMAELKKQNDALTNAATIRQQLPAEVLNAERRANETDFERNLEDVFTRVNDKGAAFAQNITYQITFGDAVVGDEGIKRIITEAIAGINRQATLNATAGR